MNSKRVWYDPNIDVKSPDAIHQILMYGTLEEIYALKNEVGENRIKELFLKNPKKVYTASALNFIKNFILDILDPISEFLRTQYIGVNIDELDEVSKSFLFRKAHFSTFNMDAEKYKDDYTVFESIKRLGLVTISPVVAHFNMSGESGFNLRQYDRYLDIHIPYDISQLGTTQLVGKAHRTFELVADYIQLHNLQIKHLMGTTYERLAQLAERFGFTIFELPLNNEFRRRVEEFLWKNHPRGQSGKNMGRTMVVYQDVNKFLERFAA